MIFEVKKLTATEKKICFRTVSSKAVFAIIGDSIKRHKSISVVRMGDGERKILTFDKNKPFTACNYKYRGWNKRMGVSGMPTNVLQKEIIEAGNSCTYFAPSISGISIPKYYLHNFFKLRTHYFSNFFVNDWTFDMIKMLLEASEGVFIIHRDYEKIINNFKKNYKFSNQNIKFAGFAKDSWKDNEQAISVAVESGMQLILFSGGPVGKIIGPKIAKSKNKIVLDIGNTLMIWSKKHEKTL
jgi:hypothetical protein